MGGGRMEAHLLKQAAAGSPQDEVKGSAQLLRLSKAQGSESP